MEHNVVVRMAKVLYGMVLAVFVFNLLVLPLVPGYTMMAYEGMGMGHPSISSLMGTMRSLLGAGVPAWEILVVRPLAMLGGDWSGYGPEVWWSAAFSWAAASVPPCSCGRPGASCPRSSPRLPFSGPMPGP